MWPDHQTISFDTGYSSPYDAPMNLARAQESLRTAALCWREGCVNSAVSRAYYAMFQAARVALAHAGFERTRWSHAGLQAVFVAELIQRRTIYPAVFRNYLATGLEIRQEADYGDAGVSQKMARRMLHARQRLCLRLRR